MNSIVFILCFLWSLRIGARILSYVHLWYVKEYRFDRMAIHLRTPVGKWTGISLPFRIPPISPKTMLLATFLVLCSFGIGVASSVSLLIRFFIIDICLFPLSYIGVFLLGVPTRAYHAMLISRSLQKLRQHKPMTVIGITGSYGKTSTKEFLAMLLSSKFKTLKTEASKNSPIAIAELLLHSLRDDHEVFVVEMAAYKKGEIAQMSKMVQPEIGILTAINEQHQDLFGSIETTMNAKYELVLGLTKKRIVICNADNEFVQQLAKRAQEDGCSVISYSRQGKEISNALHVLHAHSPKSSLTGLTFTLQYDKERVAIAAPIVGEYQISNILAAIAAARVAGMTIPEIAKATTKLHPPQKVMQPVPGIKGALFINDTFNNNPDAAIAALDVLATQKGKRIFVFQPMIELGAYTNQAHRRVGAYAAEVCDEMYVTNNNFSEAFLQGVHEKASSKHPFIGSPKEIAKKIRVSLQKGDTVLFKGKEAEFVLKDLISQK